MTTTLESPPRRPPMDPRIRERRTAIRRRKGQRRLFVLVAVATCTFGSLLILAVLHSPWLSVRTVSLSGDRHTSRQDVLRVTGLQHHPLMIDLDAGQLERRLTRLAWVNRATVSREWPSTVRISLTERVQVAAVPAAPGQWATVDHQGRVLTRSGGTAPKLPSLVGVGQPGAPGSQLPPQAGPALYVLGALGSPLPARVSSVGVEPDGEVDVTVSPGIVVQLGDASQLRQKIAAMDDVLRGVSPSGLRTIDVRVPEAPAVTRR